MPLFSWMLGEKQPKHKEGPNKRGEWLRPQK